MNSREIQFFSSLQVPEVYARLLSFALDLQTTSYLTIGHFPQKKSISLLPGIPITVGHLVGGQVFGITNLEVTH